jgi:hypothetical protein
MLFVFFNKMMPSRAACNHSKFIGSFHAGRLVSNLTRRARVRCSGLDTFAAKVTLLYGTVEIGSNMPATKMIPMFG